MTSPGDADLPQPNDLDRLLGACVETATRLLSADGEFYPFALAVTDDDEVVSPAISPPSDRPTADEVVALLLEALRAGREGLRAAAICTDVRMRSDEGEERDAIRLELEATTGDPLVVVVPYADRQLGEPFGMAGQRRVFV